MNNSITAEVSFENILIYTPGTYKLCFQIKCQNKSLEFDCQPDLHFEQLENGGFEMLPWEQPQLTDDGLQLIDNNVTVKIDKGVYTSAVFLHVQLFCHDDNKATSSRNEGFSSLAAGKLLLERRTALFSSNIEEEQEVHHKGTLQLFSIFDDLQTQIARGWIKYSMILTTKNLQTPLLSTPTNLIEKCAVSDGFSSEQIGNDTSYPVFAPFNYKAFVSEQFIECDSQPSVIERNCQPLVIDDPILDKFQSSTDDSGCRSDSILSGAGHNLKVMLETVTEEDERMMSQHTETYRKCNDFSVNTKPNQFKNISNKDNIFVASYSTDGFNTPLKEHEIFKRSTKIVRTPPNKQSVIHSTPEKESTSPARKLIKTPPLFFKRKLHVTKKSLSPKTEVKSIDENENNIEIRKSVEKVNEMEHHQRPVPQENEKKFHEQEKDIYIRRKTMESTLPDMKFEIDLPDKNAIQLMLPKFHALTTEKHFEPSVRPHVPIVEPIEETEISKENNTVPTSLSPRFKENLDDHVIAVLDYQAKELERYRNVVQRMGEDVVYLRRQIAKLKHENSQLNTRLYYSDDTVANGDSNDQLGLLKRSLAAEHQEKGVLQERVYKLQNEIIKKNEIEASYLELQAAHEITKKNIQTLQDRVSKVKLLETTCQRQEKVIEVFEKQTESKKKNEINEDRNEKLTSKETKFPFQLVDKNVNLYDIEEKLRLIEKIEQAESTIRALEEQLHINANQWARDRALLQQRDDSIVLTKPHHFDPSPVMNIQPRVRDLTQPRRSDELDRFRPFPVYSYHRRRDDNFRW